MTNRPTLDCPGCGARNTTTERRCRICTRVINTRIHEPDRGLSALHPDVGFGATFGASWGSTTAHPARSHDREGDEPTTEDPGPMHDTVECQAPRWTSSPPEPAEPLWEPTRDGSDDESYERASAIVLDVVLRNGATPPPIEYDAEHFDPSDLERDDDDHGTRWSPAGPATATAGSSSGSSRPQGAGATRR